MPTELSILAAIVIGLSGGLHCIAMCGGISSALGFATNSDQNKQFLFALAYNLGRICSYTLIGLLFGAVLSVIDTRSGIAHRLLLLLSSCLLIAIGLQIGGVLKGLGFLERWGAMFWKLLQPLALKLFPVTSLSKALCLGLFWGWLPCGLVYSTLAWSASTASPVKSAMLMAAFGVGTLPWLLASTLIGQGLHSVARSPLLRRVLGTLLVVLGVYSLYSGLNATAHEHNAHSDTHIEEVHHHH